VVGLRCRLVVGHSYIVYAPLFHGCTTILYEGKPVGTPDAGAFWRVIAEHGAVAMFTAPTAFRAIKKEDPQAKLLAQHPMPKFRTLFLAGERADPDTVQWAENILKVPDIDHWWQTETGWAIAGNPIGLGRLPVKHGSPTVAMPGYDVRIVDEAAHEMARNKMGSIVVKLPLPPGCLPSLWQQDERMRESYLAEFPGYYKTADAGFKAEDDYLYIMGRTDDIINVAGHRLSTGAIDWRHTLTSPNARCSASRTSSRARCRAASSCSRPGSIARRPISRGRSSPWFVTRSVRSWPSRSRSRWCGCRRPDPASRRRPLDHARHHRRPRDPRRDRRRAERPRDRRVRRGQHTRRSMLYSAIPGV
jgi:AMP-binding enzyme